MELMDQCFCVVINREICGSRRVVHGSVGFDKLELSCPAGERHGLNPLCSRLAWQPRPFTSPGPPSLDAVAPHVCSLSDRPLPLSNLHASFLDWIVHFSFALSNVLFPEWPTEAHLGCFRSQRLGLKLLLTALKTSSAAQVCSLTLARRPLGSRRGAGIGLCPQQAAPPTPLLSPVLLPSACAPQPDSGPASLRSRSRPGFLYLPSLAPARVCLKDQATPSAWAGAGPVRARPQAQGGRQVPKSPGAAEASGAGGTRPESRPPVGSCSQLLCAVLGGASASEADHATTRSPAPLRLLWPGVGSGVAIRRTWECLLGGGDFWDVAAKTAPVRLWEGPGLGARATKV